MGGNIQYYVAEIQVEKIVFEIVGVPEELAREAFRLATAEVGFCAQLCRTCTWSIIRRNRYESY